MPEALSGLTVELQQLLLFLGRALLEDLELLSDKGRDRMFTSASSLLEKINLLLCRGLSLSDADAMVMSLPQIRMTRVALRCCRAVSVYLIRCAQCRAPAGGHGPAAVHRQAAGSVELQQAP